METDASQLIPNLSETRLMDNAQAYFDRRLRKDRITPVSSYRGADVYHLGTGEKQSWILLVEEGKVTYFVLYKKIRHNGNHFGRQVLVMRRSPSGASGGFAQHVFFKVLLPRYKALIGDTQQTIHGQNFWINAIATAFALGYYVYILDRRSTPNRLLSLPSMKDLEANEKLLWGHDLGHRRVLPVISLNPIQLRGIDV